MKRISSNSIEKLNETSLELISVGSASDTAVSVYLNASAIALIAAPLTLGCLVGDIICSKKAAENTQNSNHIKAKRFKKASEILKYASIGFGSFGAGSSIVAAGGFFGAIAAEKRAEKLNEGTYNVVQE